MVATPGTYSVAQQQGGVLTRINRALKQPQLRRIQAGLGSCPTIGAMKNLPPKEAWAWLQAELARCDANGLEGPLFVDVRMEIESLYVGRPPGVENIPWYEYPDLTPDPARFAAAVEAEAGNKTRPVLLICRSGKRTQDAGLALEAAGFNEVAHVVHGFEGDLNDAFKRSSLNGWRHDGLPWEQM
jgi:rhodanese-related sulfurtransferase